MQGRRDPFTPLLPPYSLLLRPYPPHPLAHNRQVRGAVPSPRYGHGFAGGGNNDILLFGGQGPQGSQPVSAPSEAREEEDKELNARLQHKTHLQAGTAVLILSSPPARFHQASGCPPSMHLCARARGQGF